MMRSVTGVFLLAGVVAGWAHADLGYPDVAASVTKGLQVRGNLDLASVLSVNVEGGHIAAMPTVNRVGRWAQPLRPGGPLAAVNVVDVNGQVVGLTVQLFLVSPDKLTLTSYEIHLLESSFQLSVGSESGDDIRQASLVQNRAVAVDGKLHGVALHRPDGQRSLFAADYSTLRAVEEDSVRTVLGLAWIELGIGDMVSGLSVQAARDVTRVHAEPEAAIIASVAQLIPALASIDEAERQSARRRLSTLGQPGMDALRTFDRSTLSPNEDAELDELLRGHFVISRADLERLRGDVDTLLDLLYYNDADVRAGASDRLFELTGARVDAPAAAPDQSDWHRIEATRPALRNRPSR
jgi:hypothetical protein